MHRVNARIQLTAAEQDPLAEATEALTPLFERQQAERDEAMARELH